MLFQYMMHIARRHIEIPAKLSKYDIKITHETSSFLRLKDRYIFYVLYFLLASVIISHLTITRYQKYEARCLSLTRSDIVVFIYRKFNLPVTIEVCWRKMRRIQV